MRNIWKNVLTGGLILCLLSAMMTGCTTARPDPRGDGVLTVVATTFAGYDYARQITKNAEAGSVKLVLLGKAGQDMHSYEPTAADITTLSEADVLICLGGSVETWLDATLRSAMNEEVLRVEMMAVSETLESEHDHDHAEGETCDAEGLIGADEHVWLSPVNAVAIAAAVGDALCRADEANAAVWRAGTDAYVAELSALWEDYKAMRAAAVRDTVLIADRYPFAYLVRDLDLTCHAAFPGCSSETSASFETQAFLIEKAKELALPYIFIIDGSDGKVASVVAAESGAEILTLHSCQVVEDLSVTYIDIMKENLENLKKALS